MSDSSWVSPLKVAFPALNDKHIEIIQHLINGFTTSVDAKLHRTDFINKNEFDYISARLIAHHATSANALRKENFEHALEDAFRFEGKNVPPSDDPTRRGADIVVNGLRVSLKTCSRKSRTLNVVEISKFAESRWLREPLQRKDASEINRLMKNALNSHLADYQKIIMFANGVVGKTITYVMIEIPKTIFGLANNITDADFSACLQRNTQTLTVPLFANGQRVANLSLDGSVEKMRFLNVDVAQCFIHAEWKVDIP